MALSGRLGNFLLSVMVNAGEPLELSQDVANQLIDMMTKSYALHTFLLLNPSKTARYVNVPEGRPSNVF